MPEPRKVLVAIPAMSGEVHMGLMRSFLAEMLGLIEIGWTFDLFDIQGCSLMEDARNRMVSVMLANGFDDLIMLDSDVVWEPAAMIRLLQHPVDVVAAAYRHRKDPESYPVKWLEDRDELWADPDSGLLEVEAVATGFLRISRAGAQRMVNHMEGQGEWYRDAGAPDGKSWCLFDRIRDADHQKWGEDFSFCKRWRSIGGKVWLDPEVRMGHIGFKTFEGKIGDWLRARPVEPAAAMSSAA